MKRIKNEHIEVQTFTRPEAFFEGRNEVVPTLFLLSLESREDILAIAQLIAELHKRNWHWQSQLMVVSAINHPKLCAFLLQRNCIVIAKRLTTARGLKDRVDRQIDLLQLTQTQTASTTSPETGYRQQPDLPFSIHWTEPLLIDDDPWFVPLEKFAYQNLKYWTVEMLGPSPTLGDWIREDDKTWKWIEQSVRPSNRKQLTQGWYFQGLKPCHYENRWQFSGSSPRLYFRNKKNILSTKFSCNGKSILEVAPNSSYSINKLRQLIRSQDTFPELHSSLNKNNLFFRPVDNMLLARKFLHLALDQKSLFLIWQKNNKIRIQGTIHSIERDLSKFSILLSPESVSYCERREDLDEGKNFLGNFNIDLGCVFFASPSIFVDRQQKLLTVYPEKVFFHVQRRRALRIKIKSKTPIKIVIPHISAEIVDVSQDGVCLKFKEPDFEQLKLLEIKKATLKFEHQNIDCELDLRWSRKPVSSHGDYVKAGFQFRNLSKVDQQTLQIFIFEQNISTR